MINKITAGFDKVYYFKNSVFSDNKTDYNKSNKDYTTVPAALSLNYFVPFLGKTSSESKSVNAKNSKLENIMYYSDTPTKKLIYNLKNDALNSGFSAVTTLHVIKYSLNELFDYIEKLDSGKEDFNSSEDHPDMADIIIAETSSNILSDPNLRKSLKKIVKNNIITLDAMLDYYKKDSATNVEDVGLTEDLTDAVWGNRKEDEAIDVTTFILGAVNSPDEITSDFVEDLFNEISEISMQNHTPESNRVPFSVYDKKAENVLKNLSLGTNIFLTFDASKEIPQPFIDTVRKAIKNSGKNYSITEFNEVTSPDYFNKVVSRLGKDKSKEHIIIADPVNILISKQMEVDENGKASINIPKDFLETIANPPANVKYLFYSTKNNYYNFAVSSNLFPDFEEVTLPGLSTAQMIKSFKENPVLMNNVQKQFSKNALEKVVEASAQLDGVFPSKTINLMKKIVSYYIDKKEINEADVSNYLKEATNLLKKAGDDSSIEIFFDTGKKLNDLVGKNSTKKEAASLVKQIKSKKMGTKGIIIYSQDGSPGSGRRYTAKAIAGEARVPYIEINTMDFGTKDVDIFGGGALSPEASMKKLFSIVNTQAEANPNKSAVLFIENFEYFSVGELVSNYHQKAMAQLLREMDKAEKSGLNILVVGSVSNPSLIGEAAMKSFKFVDNIEVSSPAYNKGERAEIIRQTLKDEKIKLAGDSKTRENTIESAANIANGFPYIYLKNLVKKAKTVAMERGHKALTKADFTEAYLQITTGRPAINHIEDHEKRVVASHECGHAVNLEVMNNIAKTLGKPWHIPNKVNFITLDPRGYYGGAVYHGQDKNSEMSFENLFADIVCSFGGNSAEKLFYGMDGSYGISADMDSVRRYTDLMVKSLGMGVNTGKMVINSDDDLSENLKTMIEKDERIIINNAKIASDLITEIYSDFNKQFSKKYAPLVGTGECILDGDDFRNVLNKWKSEQNPEMQAKLKLCDEAVLKIIDATKKGIAVRKEN